MANISHLLFITSIYLLLILSSPVMTIAPPSSVQDYEVVKPQKNHVYAVKNCMPKGFRHASAPRRYVNDHITSSSDCSTSIKDGTP